MIVTMFPPRVSLRLCIEVYVCRQRTCQNHTASACTTHLCDTSTSTRCLRARLNVLLSSPSPDVVAELPICRVSIRIKHILKHIYLRDCPPIKYAVSITASPLVVDIHPLHHISWYEYCLFVSYVCLCSEVLQPGGSSWYSSLVVTRTRTQIYYTHVCACMHTCTHERKNVCQRRSNDMQCM